MLNSVIFYRSITLIIQAILPCLLFGKTRTIVKMRGGTNVGMAPPIDYTTEIFQTVVKKFGVQFSCHTLTRLSTIRNVCSIFHIFLGQSEDFIQEVEVKFILLWSLWYHCKQQCLTSHRCSSPSAESLSSQELFRSGYRIATFNESSRFWRNFCVDRQWNARFRLKTLAFCLWGHSNRH